jgi:hypothetical protein
VGLRAERALYFEEEVTTDEAIHQGMHQSWGSIIYLRV